MSGSMFGSWFVPQSQPDLGSDINPDVNRLWAAMQANPVGTSQLHPQTAGNATPIDPVAGRWNGQPVTQGQMDALPANLLTGQLNPSGADAVNATLGMMGGIKPVDVRDMVAAMKITPQKGRSYVLQGKPGDLHDDVVSRAYDADESLYDNTHKSELGFADQSTGRWYSRDDAAKAIGVHEASDLPSNPLNQQLFGVPQQ